MEKGTVKNLKGLVSPVGDSIVSQELMKNDAGTVTIFHIAKGQGLSTHTAPFDAFVLAVRGIGEITIGGKSHELRSLDTIIMPANIPHSVQAREDFTMLLVMLKSQFGGETV